MKPMSFLSCTYASVCSGCDWLLKPIADQRDLKQAAFNEAWSTAAPVAPAPWPEMRFIEIANGALRDRVDLMFDRRSGSPRLGLFDRFRTGIVDLQGCPQMSPDLEAWLREFRRIDFPIARGSIRLRVSPSGLKGAWLDFANVDVKTLLDDRKTLDRLRETGAVIEIGQRRKRLIEIDGRLKLGDPVLEPWFETYFDGQPMNLYCSIGSFTQPGFKANRALLSETLEQVKKARSHLDHEIHAAEFGSGIGNFTLPLAKTCSRVDAYEVDVLALEGLRKSLDEYGLNDKVEIHSGNFQGEKGSQLDFAGVDLLLVDPPRSGLMRFLDPVEALEPNARPKAIVYVSCFADSFAVDSSRLFQLGYRCTDLAMVDQFPQSRHFETVATFLRD